MKEKLIRTDDDAMGIKRFYPCLLCYISYQTGYDPRELLSVSAFGSTPTY